MAEVQAVEMICRENLATVWLKSRLKQVKLFGEILQQSIQAWAKEVHRLHRIHKRSGSIFASPVLKCPF